VPDVVWERSTRRVLVLEDVSAIKITDAEGLRAAAGDSGFAARINWRLLSRGVDAALRDHGLPHVLEFLRDADRIGVQAAVMLDPDASDAVAAACRQLLDERIMVEFVEAIEALASNVTSNLLMFFRCHSVVSSSLVVHQQSPALTNHQHYF
jgi:hypothetical protein